MCAQVQHFIMQSGRSNHNNYVRQRITVPVSTHSGDCMFDINVYNNIVQVYIL